MLETGLENDEIDVRGLTWDWNILQKNIRRIKQLFAATFRYHNVKTKLAVKKLSN